MDDEDPSADDAEARADAERARRAAASAGDHESMELFRDAEALAERIRRIISDGEREYVLVVLNAAWILAAMCGTWHVVRGMWVAVTTTEDHSVAV